LAAIATIVGGTGYVLEKWQETVASIDFSGEIDQKKPFSVPLVAKNPSEIFSIHLPRMSCETNVEYYDGDSHHAVAYGDQGGASGAAIPPQGTADYFCDVAAALTVTDKPGGTVIPIKQAEMTVTLDYETWVPWSIERQVKTRFVMFAASDGYRWQKGDWIGGHPGVPRPPNLESLPPTFVIPQPAKPN
jgi:hypothetical protein